MGCESRSRVRSDQPFSQGQTADRVLIQLNTEPSASDLIKILSSVVLRVGLETFSGEGKTRSNFRNPRATRERGSGHEAGGLESFYRGEPQLRPVAMG